jgi:hypothetical protein
MIPIIGIAIAGLGLIIGILQVRARRQERAERLGAEAAQQRKEDEARAEQTRRAQAPPKFYNFSGEPGPIAITGFQHSAQGPFVDLWGLVTVVNPTPVHMKISPLRLVLGGEEWTVRNFFFRLKSDPRDRFERISLTGDTKEDYELHLMFPDDKYPTSASASREGGIWFSSDNRPEEFEIKVRFP